MKIKSILFLLAMQSCIHAMEQPSFWGSTFNEWAPSWMLSKEEQIQRATNSASKIINEYKYFQCLRGYTAYEEYKELIKNGANPNIPDLDGETALLSAIVHRDQEFAELLISKGASLDVPEYCKSKVRVFTEAVSQNNLTLVRRLIKNGAEVNKEGGAVSGAYSTPLNIAAQNQCLGMVRLLLANGANLTLQCTKQGYTALYATISNPFMPANLEIIALLLQSGMNIDQRSNQGFTPLMKIAFAGNAFIPESHSTAIASLLIASGADREICDKNGRSALDYANHKYNIQIARLLTEKKKIH